MSRLPAVVSQMYAYWQSRRALTRACYKNLGIANTRSLRFESKHLSPVSVPTLLTLCQAPCIATQQRHSDVQEGKRCAFKGESHRGRT